MPMFKTLSNLIRLSTERFMGSSYNLFLSLLPSYYKLTHPSHKIVYFLTTLMTLWHRRCGCLLDVSYSYKLSTVIMFDLFRIFLEVRPFLRFKHFCEYGICITGDVCMSISFFFL